MRVLFDQGTPIPLRKHLPDHRIETAFERGWSNLRNGALLDRAEADGFELLVTTDQRLRHQQNLSGRRLAVLVLMSTSWPRIEARVDEITDVIERIASGECMEVAI